MKSLFIEKQNLFILIFILFIATYLRFRNLTFDSFWLDELFSMDFSNPNKSFSEMIKLTLEDVHPPLYQFLLWLWLKLFGFTEYSARSFSAILGVCTTLVAYYFTKEFYKEKIALSISFIFATNIFLIFFSHEVRSYQLTVLLCMLSYMFLYKTVITKKNKNLYIYWIITIVWIYTHYYSLFIITSQLFFILIYMFTFEKDIKCLVKMLIKTVIIFCISILPLVPYLLLSTDADKFWFIQKPSITYFLNYIHFYFGYGGLYFILFSTLLSIFFIYNKKIEKKEKIVLLLFITWIIFGYLLPYLKSIFSFPVTQARYSIVMIPAIVLFSIYGISKLRTIFQIIILILFSIFSLKVIFIDFGNKVYKQQYRESLKFVSNYNNVPIYELIPTNGHNGNNTNHFQVYSDILHLDITILDDTQFIKDYNNEKVPECFWTIYTFHSPNLDKIDDVLNIYNLSNNLLFENIYTKKYQGSQATLFSVKNKKDKCLSYVDIND